VSLIFLFCGGVASKQETFKGEMEGRGRRYNILYTGKEKIRQSQSFRVKDLPLSPRNIGVEAV